MSLMKLILTFCFQNILNMSYNGDRNVRVMFIWQEHKSNGEDTIRLEVVSDVLEERAFFQATTLTL